MKYIQLLKSLYNISVNYQLCISIKMYLDGPFDGMSTPPVKQEEEGSFGDVGRIMQVY